MSDPNNSNVSGISHSSHDLSGADYTEEASKVAIEWEVGDVILGLYRVDGILGEGGMGRVYKVRHRNWGVNLAVKSPKPELLQNPKAVDRFVSECEMWINLGLHPHVVSCYYVRKLGPVPRIFAECVAGPNLYTAITKGLLYKGGHRDATARILSIAAQTAWGLQHAHEHNLVHCDVKPHNVLLTPEWTAKVTDFGLAQAVSEELGEAEQRRGGMTPAFASPEQLQHTGTDFHTDQWSWAATVLAMFIGKIRWKRGDQALDALHAFIKDGPSDPALVPPIPPGMAEVLGACLNMDSKKRPPNMDVIADRIAQIYAATLGRQFPYQRPAKVDALASNLNNRAVSLMDLNKREEAISKWQEALRNDASHTQSIYNLGLTLWRAGRTADDALLNRIAQNRNSAGDGTLSAYQMFQIHLERGDVDSAKRLMEHEIQAQGAVPQLTEGVRRAEAMAAKRRGLERRLEGHADDVRALWISPEGNQAISGSADNTVRLWSIPDGECIREFTGHTGSVESVWGTRDGRLVFSASQDRTYRLWERSTDECVKCVDVPREATHACAMSGDKPVVIARHNGPNVAKWDLISGSIAGQNAVHHEHILCAVVSYDEKVALTGGNDGRVVVWDLESLEPIRVMEGDGTPIACISMSQNGDFAVTGSPDKKLRLWDVAKGTCIRVISGHTDQVNAVSMSTDGRFCLSGSSDGTVRFWYMRAGRCLTTLEGHTGPVRAVALPQEGPYAVSGGDDNSISVWHLGDRRQHYKAAYMLCRMQHAEAAVTSDSEFKKYIAAARDAMAQQRWDVAAGTLRQAQKLRGYERHSESVELWARMYPILPRTELLSVRESETMHAHSGAVTSICVNGDGRLMLSGGADRVARLWDLGNYGEILELSGHSSGIRSVDMTPDASIAVTGGEDQTIRVWDLTNGEFIREMENVGGSVESLDLSPDGKFLLAGGWDMAMWDLETGLRILTFEGHDSDVVSVRWSMDGRQAFSGSSDETVRVWNVANGQCLQVLSGHTGSVRTLCVTTDGLHVLSASANMYGRPGKLRLWQVLMGENIAVLEGHESSVNSVSTAFGSNIALSGGQDKSVRIWDLAAQECLYDLRRHAAGVTATCFAPDARYAVSGDADGHINFWAMDWDLNERYNGSWDPAMHTIMMNYLYARQPLGAEVDPQVYMDVHTATKILTRKGKPEWTDKDTKLLRYELGCAGLGMPRLDVLEAEVKKAIQKMGRRTLFGSR